jgi:molybdopterin converting factor small subunit
VPPQPSVTLHIPRELRAYCAGAPRLALPPDTIRATLDRLEADHSALYRCICDETGAVRRHLNLFVNTNHMRDRNGLETRLSPGDDLIIVPAVSGG